MLIIINRAQNVVSTDAERYLLVYMIAVLVIITGLIVLFFIVFQKRKNKLLVERLEREREFEEEILKTQTEIQEQTLKHIGWELHDNVGQLLAYANMQMNMLMAKAPNELYKNLYDSNQIVKQCLAEVRALSKSLNNDVLLNLGFKESLINEMQRLKKLKFSSAELEIKGDEKPLANSKHEIVLFRILQEFFSNSIKYSEAETIRVTLDYKSDHLLILAEDDGQGFDLNNAEKGSGLINMQSRAALINSQLKLSSQPGEGVQLSIMYPFES